MIDGRGVAVRASEFVVAAIGASLVFAIWHAQPSWMIDFQVYRAGASAVLRGDALYDVRVTAANLPFTYPPFAAILFIPLALVPLGVAEAVSLLMNVVCLQVVIRRCLALVDVHGRGWALGGSLAAIVLPPVWWTLQLGQVNIVLMLLVLLDVTRERRLRGSWVGTAMGVKLVPGIFLLYFLLRRQYRALAVGAAAFAATVVAGFALLPRDSTRYWGGVVVDVGRTSVFPQPWEQDLRATLHRLLHGGVGLLPLWIFCCVVVLVLATAVVLAASRRGEELVGVLAFAAAGLLVSPVAWEHHWVWVVPLFVLLSTRSCLGWCLAAVVLAALLFRPFGWAISAGDLLDLTPVQLLWTSWLPLLTVALLIAALVHVRRVPEVPPRPCPPTRPERDSGRGNHHGRRRRRF